MKKATIPHSWLLHPLPPGVKIWPVVVGRVDRVDRPRHGGTWPYAMPNYVVRGRVRRKGPEGEIEIGPGQFYCNWPDVPYEIIHEHPDEPWKSYWLRMEGPDTPDLLRALGFSATNLVVRVPDPGQALNAFRELHRYYGKTAQRDPYRALSLLYGLVSVCRPIGLTVSKPGRADLVGQAQALIESLLDTGLNATELARMLGVSRNTLLAAFRETLGRTPIGYLQQVRMERAKRLLRTTDGKLRAIAMACGYRNEKYFLRCFRASERMTPTRWRCGKINSRG